MKDALGHGSDSHGGGIAHQSGVDAKGHGSDPRGAHAEGVNQIGRGSLNLPVYYHGSPLGEPGIGPVHVGTALAAKEALEARIGIPADGKGWNGDREYGKTLLAGTDTLRALAKQGYHGGYPEIGYNSGAPSEGKVPQHDYYATERATLPTMGSSHTPIPLDAKPAVAPYNIVGRMSGHMTTDDRANAMVGRLKNQGVFYKNKSEDLGSPSAVVPNKTFLRRVK